MQSVSDSEAINCSRNKHYGRSAFHLFFKQTVATDNCVFISHDVILWKELSSWMMNNVHWLFGTLQSIKNKKEFVNKAKLLFLFFRLYRYTRFWKVESFLCNRSVFLCNFFESQLTLLLSLLPLKAKVKHCSSSKNVCWKHSMEAHCVLFLVLCPTFLGSLQFWYFVLCVGKERKLVFLWKLDEIDVNGE